MTDSGVVLYRAPATRSLSALWVLEELGVDYRMETVRLQSPEYLKINPRGWTPTVVDGATKVMETAAICLHLADRYGYGTLAPRLEDPARGPYVGWTVWSTAVLEPSSAMDGHEVPPRHPGAWHFGFGRLEDELPVLEAALVEGGGYVAGGRFTAADVMVGSVVGPRLFTAELPRLPWLVAYFERLEARPAYQRAAKINWPPEQFGDVKPTPA